MPAYVGLEVVDVGALVERAGRQVLEEAADVEAAELDGRLLVDRTLLLAEIVVTNLGGGGSGQDPSRST